MGEIAFFQFLREIVVFCFDRKLRFLGFEGKNCFSILTQNYVFKKNARFTVLMGNYVFLVLEENCIFLFWWETSLLHFL